MTFTALHRALGLEPRPLDFGMVEDAVDRGLIEQADLDWKRSLPMAGKNPEWKNEFAKDVAAMANSGGGVIVYGVEESNAAAIKVVDTGELTDRQERELRSIAFSAIHPPVLGTSFTPISKGDATVVVLHVPASEDAPHLIYKGDYFAAPLRDGSRTSWMKEKLIENSYRQRIDNRSQRTATLAERIDQPRGNTQERVWMVAAAAPMSARRTGGLDVDMARRILKSARERRFSFAERGAFAPFEIIEGLNPRPGLRRWVDKTPTPPEGARASQEVVVEVHHDGAATMASSLGGFLGRDDGGGNHVHTDGIEGLVADFIALVSSTAREAGIDGLYEVAVALRWDGKEPIFIRIPDSHNYLLDTSYSRPIHHFETVYSGFEAGSSDDTLLLIANQIALDVVNQGGGQYLRRIKTPNSDV
ncbi:helix-turn-helix domain-containing protein [Pseudarthrobacter scleromae]|uniref:AlbA family DNA-binding domain-containing protein n=1 Tax=Pseudarthrobacter scleromae TaxID=158897 RepID=UPI003644B9DD